MPQQQKQNKTNSFFLSSLDTFLVEFFFKYFFFSNLRFDFLGILRHLLTWNDENLKILFQLQYARSLFDFV